MIAIIYSGSRYASWKLFDKGQVVSDFETAGINPFFNDEKFIQTLLNKNNELVTHAEKIKKIYFFGAGASSPERKRIVADAFRSFFRHGKVVVERDLKAAALATCPEDQGIVAILGSGSNAAYFNGKKIIENNFGLGFILNDEGSANWLGRKLLNSYLTETLPVEFREKFIHKYNLDRKQILDKVYKHPQPLLFLSSFSGFLMENKDEEYVRILVKDGFQRYLQMYIVPLAEQYPGVLIHFVGTVAAGFEDWLREIALKNNVLIDKIIQHPIYNVLNYYLDKN